MNCIHGNPLAECQLCEIVKYTLDYPEEAALEIARLRKENADLHCPGLPAICAILGLVIGALFF